MSKHIKSLKKLKIFHKCSRKERHDLEGAGNFEMRAGKDFSKKYFLLSTGNRAADKTDISPYSHGVYILVYILGHRQQDKKGGYTVCQKDLLRRSIKQKRGWPEDRMEWSECPVK